MWRAILGFLILFCVDTYVTSWFFVLSSLAAREESIYVKDMELASGTLIAVL